MKVRCAGLCATSGLQCARRIESPATHCAAHEPGGHEQQVALAAAGGRATAAAQAERRRAVINSLRTLEDVNCAVEKAAAMVCTRTDPEATRRASVLLQAAKEARELIKVRDLERRLAALEAEAAAEGEAA
jgi:hypothetical protein